MSNIAITGIGIVSPLGIGKKTFWENCRKAETGIKKIASFDTGSLRSNIAGVVEDFQPKLFMPPAAYRKMSRVSRMSVAASIEAIKDSGLDMGRVNRERVAVIMGTAYGSSSRVEDFYVSLLKDGPRGAQPFLFPETVPNAPASHISMFHDITGPNTTFCQNALSAENAILYARNLLLQGQVDIVLVGGADELSSIVYSCYDALGALNKVKVINREQVCPRPGRGLVLGEGSGILVMERLDFALERKADIYGIFKTGLITGGITSIGHYETEGEQMGRAISLSLKNAGLEPDDIDQIDVSANFSGEAEEMEYVRIKQIFGNRSGSLEVIPLKYLFGDFGGAGIIRAAAILLSIHHQEPLPAINIEALKGKSPGPVAWNRGFKRKIGSVLMISSTFGGGSAGLIFSGFS
ncbi:MAG: hypothetical protein J7L16_10430 [Deltaproteobacteria bacterium]|nr:hypothetical protein [Deltaproteobacteria bacterium]